jgi:hypothetical protein
LKKDLGPKAIKVTIKGDGDDPRQIEITENRYS